MLDESMSIVWLGTGESIVKSPLFSNPCLKCAKNPVELLPGP